MVNKPKIYDAKLSKIVSLTPTVKHFILNYPSEADLNITAGQFVMAYVEKDGRSEKKAYSIACSPSLAREKKQLELCIKLVEGGFVTGYFFALKEGDALRTSLPYGIFTIRKPWVDHYVMVGTGTGIAPLRSLIQDLFEQGCTKEISLIFGNRYETDILYRDEWVALEKKHKNFHFIPTVSRDKNWSGETAYVQEIVKKRFFGKTDGVTFYSCGVVPMCLDLKKTLLDMNVPKERVHFEQYT